nr:immunoglobulin heavy chain junction region [Mus musculus]
CARKGITGPYFDYW